MGILMIMSWDKKNMIKFTDVEDLSVHVLLVSQIDHVLWIQLS